jgi:uncharacterized protein (UPF0335 family)
METKMQDLARDEELTGPRPDGESSPDELGAIKQIVSEFITRLQNIENEISLLKEDRKELIEEYRDRIDMVTLQAAIKTVKIRANVQHKDTFDNYLSVLEEDDV